MVSRVDQYGFVCLSVPIFLGRTAWPWDSCWLRGWQCAVEDTKWRLWKISLSLKLEMSAN